MDSLRNARSAHAASIPRIAQPMQIQKKVISEPPRACVGAVVVMAPASMGSVVTEAVAIEIDIKLVRLTVNRRTLRQPYCTGKLRQTAAYHSA